MRKNTLSAPARSRAAQRIALNSETRSRRDAKDHRPGVDRQEVGQDSRSAVQELEQGLQIPVVSIVQLEDLVDMLEESGEYGEFLEPVVKYREQFGS